MPQGTLLLVKSAGDRSVIRRINSVHPRQASELNETNELYISSRVANCGMGSV